MNTLGTRFSVLLLALITVLTLAPQPVSAATLTVDDDGVDCPGAGFTAVGTAVLAAADGDTIEICSGVYVEQVTLTKRLTLQARPGHLPLLQAPPAMAEPRAIIRVGAGFVAQVTIEGLSVKGPGGAGCGSIRAGIRVDSGSSATIRNNRITDIREDPLGNCASGVGILVGRQSDVITGTATIVGNVIEDYQKAGIVIDNAGSSASVRGNRIAGVGPTGVIAQNGIQVSRGAHATITENEIVFNFFLNPQLGTNPNCPEGAMTPVAGECAATATAILIFQSGGPVAQAQFNAQNTLRSNQAGVIVVP
jgi:hypothetical protein